MMAAVKATVVAPSLIVGLFAAVLLVNLHPHPLQRHGGFVLAAESGYDESVLDYEAYLRACHASAQDVQCAAAEEKLEDGTRRRAKLKDGRCPFHALLSRKSAEPLIIRRGSHELNWPCFGWTENTLLAALSKNGRQRGLMVDVKRLPPLHASYMFPSDQPLAKYPSVYNASWSPHFSRHDVSPALIFAHAACVAPTETNPSTSRRTSAVCHEEGDGHNAMPCSRDRADGSKYTEGPPSHYKSFHECFETECRRRLQLGEEADVLVDSCADLGVPVSHADGRDGAACGDGNLRNQPTTLDGQDDGYDDPIRMASSATPCDEDLFAKSARFKFASPLEAAIGKELAEDFPFVRGVPCDIETHDYFEVRPYLWIGEAGARTPTHYDVFNNIYFQLIGNKTFYLTPMSSHSTYGLQSRLHPAHRSTRLQLSANEERLEGVKKVTLSPGDILILPALTLHEVVSDTLSVSVNVWSGYEPTHLAMEAEEAFERLFSAQELMDSSARDAIFREIIVLIYQDLGYSDEEWEELVLSHYLLERYADLHFPFHCNAGSASNGEHRHGEGRARVSVTCAAACSAIALRREEKGNTAHGGTHGHRDSKTSATTTPSCREEDVVEFLHTNHHLVPILSSTASTVINNFKTIQGNLEKEVVSVLLMNVLERVAVEVVSPLDVMQLFYDITCCMD